MKSSERECTLCGHECGPPAHDSSRGLSQTIPWNIGETDDSYSAMVWAGRVYNLRAHLLIIADHLSEGEAWLRGQVSAAIAEAEGYLRDWSPLCDSGAENAKGNE